MNSNKFIIDQNSSKKVDISSFGLISIIILIVLLGAQGCSRTTIDDQATRRPSSTITPTPTRFVFNPQITISSSPTIPSPTQIPPPKLRKSPYINPENTFEISLPIDWEIKNDIHSSKFVDPHGTGFIKVQAVNTGYRLDNASFQRFVDATEENLFESSFVFDELLKDNDQGGSVIKHIKKVSNNGEMFIVTSAYHLTDQGIYISENWLLEENFDAYEGYISEIMNTLKFNSKALTDLGIYYSNQITHSNGFQSIEIPASWKIVQTSGENTAVSSYYSPDQKAIIQVVEYDDEEVMTKSMAGALALILLRDYYTNDVEVISDQLRQDGREELTWISQQGNYQGATIFWVQGTTLFIFTVMVDIDSKDIYNEFLEMTLSKSDFIDIQKIND